MSGRGRGRYQRSNHGIVYTRKGENTEYVAQKTFAFKSIWPQILEDPSIDIDSLQKPNDITDIMAWNELTKMLKEKDKFAWLMRIHRANINPLRCTDQELRDFLVKEFFESDRKIGRINTLTGYCSEIRRMLFAIGREYDYGNGHEESHVRVVYAYTGNPMTPSTEQYLVRKYQENPPPAPNPDEPYNKHSYPISVAIAFINMIWVFAKMMDLVKKWELKKFKHTPRIENLCMLILMYIFLLHEGGRPGDANNMETKHSELWLITHPFDYTVYWLTLVFIRPETLAFLLAGNKIAKIVVGNFKGKDKQYYLHRIKAVIPAPFNSIDILTIYTICMRMVIYTTNGTNLTDKIIKNGLQTSSLRHRIVHKIFKWFTFYSFRYAAAEEDKKAKIPDSWTRQRMGHTENSTQKDKYADNKGRRVTYGEDGKPQKPLPLGMDMYERPTNPDHIKLECVIVPATGITYETDWLEKTFPDSEDGDMKEAKEDFMTTSKMVADFIDAPSQEEKIKAKHALLQRFKEHTTREKNPAWYSIIPLGFHIKLPSSIVPDLIRTIYNEAKSHLEEAFSGINTPKVIPELWSFPQVVFGNWRNLLTIKRNSKTDMEEPVTGSLPIPEDDEEDVDDDIPGPSIHQPPTKKARKNTASETGSETESVTEALDIEDIEPNDIVIIYATLPKKSKKNTKKTDTSIFKLPNFPDKHVWVSKAVHVEKIDENTASYQGYFYYNATQNIMDPMNVRKNYETITIKEDSVVKIFTPDTADSTTKAFSLSPENISEIEARFI